MSMFARQSTARSMMVGPILDADGAAVTTAVIGDLKISKNGGAPAALNGSATLTHRHTGHYSLALTASDLDTVGQAEVTLDATTNAMPVKVITVIEEAIYDALFAASANAWSGAAGASVAAVADLYHADIELTVDEDNTREEYTATWFKNGVRQTSGITSPTIQVVKRVDGTDLIASTPMTQIGSTGSYKYDESTNRITEGEAVLVIVAATIDSGGRTFARLCGRDSG